MLWRPDLDQPRPTPFETTRFPAIDEALRAQGFNVTLVAYEEESSTWRDAALASDAVLVWVDPLSAGRTRERLDDDLREVARRGVVVSTHPDTIARMGTKDVLYDTRFLSWSLDVDRYVDVADVEDRLRARLRAGERRVLKPRRGNGGQGVWKVERAHELPGASSDFAVRVQEAAPRDGASAVVVWSSLVARWREDFARGEVIIDQAFAPGVGEGMVRVYVVESEVIGFARQYPPAPDVVAPQQVFGLPGAKTMLDVAATELRDLRATMEHEWIPQLQSTLGIANARLPLLWDADFFPHGTHDARPRYVLGEINVSCVSPFPPLAPTRMARRLRQRLDGE
ncbi:MAG: Cj0069 family protein [Acidobacteriota bacterium]|nr:Cj0069 family protein [Acidobacteriota bacterium]